MAQPVVPSELGSWRGEGVGLGQVMGALTALRRSGQRTATRASVTNLVVVASDEEEVARACEAVHRLGRRHPGRSIVLLPRADALPAGIDADVLLHGSLAGGHPVWSEDIRLEVRGAPAAHLDSLIVPLTLADLPVAVWFVGDLPDPAHPLLRAANILLVDTEGLGATAVAPMLRLTRGGAVFDLCWARLRPWRQLMAALFEVPACRPFLAGVRQVHARGGAMPRLLLGGWVASRLALPPAMVTLAPAAAPSLRLVADYEGATATFEVGPADGGSGPAAVRASSDLGLAGLAEERLSLPDDPLAWSLGEGLTHLGGDRAHNQALRAAVGFAS